MFVDGAGSDTAIYTTWSDWTGGTPDSYQAYTESSVPMSAILSGNFPYGLCCVGDTRDEIDMGTKTAISRITRMAYSAENLESARASGRAFEYDENYIYIVRATPVSSAITVEEEYTVSEHGLEFFDGTAVAVYAEILYGTNLKDKLKRDVLTISSQQLTDAQKIQARNNIGAVSQVLENGLAILANGDTHAAITVGQRVYVRNHSTLTEGLYKATAAIQTNGPLTTSNLTTEPSGALNDLKASVDSLNSNMPTVPFKATNRDGTDCNDLPAGLSYILSTGGTAKHYPTNNDYYFVLTFVNTSGATRGQLAWHAGGGTSLWFRGLTGAGPESWIVLG